MKTNTTVYLDMNDIIFLDEYAHKNKLSRSALIQKAIKDLISKIEIENNPIDKWV